MMGSSAFVIYDALICLSMESTNIWHTKLTGATILYVLNRYFYIIGAIILVAGKFMTSGSNSVSIPAICSNNVVDILSQEYAHFSQGSRKFQAHKLSYHLSCNCIFKTSSSLSLLSSIGLIGKPV